jgi:hypothetical protein
VKDIYVDGGKLARNGSTMAIFVSRKLWLSVTMPERIYNPITAMGFSAMFTFQLDNTKR